MLSLASEAGLTWPHGRRWRPVVIIINIIITIIISSSSSSSSSSIAIIITIIIITIIIIICTVTVDCASTRRSATGCRTAPYAAMPDDGEHRRRAVEDVCMARRCSMLKVRDSPRYVDSMLVSGTPAYLLIHVGIAMDVRIM